MEVRTIHNTVFSKAPLWRNLSASKMRRGFVHGYQAHLCLNNYSKELFMKSKRKGISIFSFLLGSILFFMSSAPGFAQVFQYQAIALGGGGRSNYFDTGGTGLKNIDMIAASGANALTLCINSRLDIKNNESSFASALDDSTSYSNIKKAAIYAKSKRLKVILKPFVMGTQGVLQNSNYCPPDGDAFFASVENDLMNNVKLARDVGAEMLIIGTELGGKISSNHSPYGYDNCSAWHKIIRNIRAAAPKLKLTYSATMTNTWNKLSSNEAPRICFWDALDYIGFNAYPDMNNISPTASVNDFYNRLFDNGNPISKGGDDGTADTIFSLTSFESQYGIKNQSWVRYIEFVTLGIRKLTKRPDMKVIIPEIGAASTGNVFGYWGSYNDKTLQYEAQANGWDAVLKALATDKAMRSMVVGISVWAVNAGHDPSDTTSTRWKTDFDVVGKPAYEVIKKWFTSPRP